MKSKNGAQTRVQKTSAWLPLLIAACLMLLGFVLKICSNGYLEPHGMAMFYPLAIVMKSSWQGLLQGLIGGSVILLHLLALKRGVDRDDVFGSALVTGIFVVVVAVLSPFHTYEMIPLQALSTEDHTYRLVLRQWENSDTNPSMYAPHSLYVVLECDQFGLICGYLVTPTECIEEGATLVLEPTTHRVLMLMGTKVYDVKAMEDTYYPHCITKGLNR